MARAEIMDSAEVLESQSKPFFSPKQVAEARLTAAQTRRSVVEVLEEQSGLSAESFVRALSGLLHHRVFVMADLHRLTG